MSGSTEAARCAGPQLASNAAKYGALSDEAGRLDVSWSIVSDPRTLELRWRETLGRPLVVSGRRGFGTNFIERSLAHELSGTAALEFKEDGLDGWLRIPMSRVEDGGVEREAPEDGA